MTAVHIRKKENRKMSSVQLFGKIICNKRIRIRNARKHGLKTAHIHKAGKAFQPGGFPLFNFYIQRTKQIVYLRC